MSVLRLGDVRKDGGGDAAQTNNMNWLRKIATLQAKLTQTNEVVAELLQEHVPLKKELGEL